MLGWTEEQQAVDSYPSWVSLRHWTMVLVFLLTYFVLTFWTTPMEEKSNIPWWLAKRWLDVEMFVVSLLPFNVYQDSPRTPGLIGLVAVDMVSPIQPSIWVHPMVDSKLHQLCYEKLFFMFFCSEGDFQCTQLRLSLNLLGLGFRHVSTVSF